MRNKKNQSRASHKEKLTELNLVQIETQNRMSKLAGAGNVSKAVSSVGQLMQITHVPLK